MESKEQNSDEKIRNILSKLDRNAIIIGLVGIIFLFGFTITATQYNLWFDFNNTGQIGDTIGGLTAPIIGIFSSLLIYFSFRAQIKANLTIQQQITDQKKEEIEKRKINHLIEIYNHLKGSFEDFQYRDSNIGSMMTGSPAFHKFWNILLSAQESVQIGSTKSFDNILKLFDILLNEIKKNKENKIDVDLVMFLTELQFDQFIWDSYIIEVEKGKFTNGFKSSFYERIKKIEQIHEKILLMKDLVL